MSYNQRTFDPEAQTKDAWSTDIQELYDQEDEHDSKNMRLQRPEDDEYSMVHQNTQTEEGVHPGRPLGYERSVSPLTPAEFDRSETPSALSPGVYDERGTVPFPPARYDI